MRCRWCVGFACEVNAKCGTQNTVIPKAIDTGNCELRCECIAKEILTDARGRVTGVAYFDSAGRLQEQSADLVIVSCAAIESARLLLNSKSRLFPNGLGNRSDWVGRNLQGHAYTGALGLFEQETYDDLGPGASIAICDFSHNNPGLRGRRNAGQRIYSPALSVCLPQSRKNPELGRGPQRLHAPFLSAEYLRHGTDPGDAGLRIAGAG